VQDEHAALTKHFSRVSHQKIEVDIFGKVSGHDAIKLPVQNHFFCSSMNKFDIGQLEIPGLFLAMLTYSSWSSTPIIRQLGKSRAILQVRIPVPLACWMIRLDVFGILFRILRFHQPSSPKVEKLAI
jgi:hypothetical protein